MYIHVNVHVPFYVLKSYHHKPLQLHQASLRWSTARRLWVQRRLVERLSRRRDIQRWVLREETIRSKHDTNLLHGHDWEVLNTRVMGKSECWETLVNSFLIHPIKTRQLTMPEDNILVLNRILSVNPLLNTLRLLALVGEFPSSIELSVLVSGHPDRLGSEPSPTSSERVLACQHHLRRRCLQLVGDGVVGNWIDDVVIADFEYPVTINTGVGASAVLEHCLFGCLADLPGVVFIFWEWY